MKKFTILKNNIFFIFILSFTIFFIKWSISYWYYGIEDIFTKIIFNPSGDHSYYPFVHQFSNLNFAEGYSILFKKLNLIGFPYIASLAHTIFYKVFGLYGFIIMELLCIFFFLIIFFYIFKEINFTNEYSIILAFFLFSLPLILILINEFSIPYIFNLKQLYSGFYSLRFPRPLVTNLFFFAFILFILKFYLSNEINSKKYFLISSLFIGLLFNSFFYFSLVCFGLANILFIIKYKKIILKKTILKKYLHFILRLFFYI